MRHNLFHKIHFKVEWLPFFLNSNIPAQGVGTVDYIKSVYGSANQLDQIRQRLVMVGKQVGINFAMTLDSSSRVYPTLHSHRLVEYSKSYGLHEQVFFVLF